MKTTIYTHQSALEHNTGTGHPESAERLKALYELFEEEPFASLPQKRAQSAEIEQIMRAHSEDYIFDVEEATPSSGTAYLDNDTVISPESWKAAMHAAGAVCQAVDDIAGGQTTRAFCAVRPPGHHALPDQAMGFCIFNNIFIGARHAQEAHGIGKIAIVDFDVHHGNGTDAMTRAHNGNIFYISTHQYPLWPMSGLPEDNDEKVCNWTLEPGAGSTAFRALYTEKVFPALRDFAPDLLMISAGFDAHAHDPIGGLNLQESDYEWVTKKLSEISESFCNGKIISVLEGGYDVPALKGSVASHLTALAKT